MLEIYEFFINNRNKPLEYTLLAALLFIADRLGRKFITSQVKRLFRVEDRSYFEQYVQNQRRIESKLELLLQKEGITWPVHTFTQDSLNTATKRKRSLLPRSAGLLLAQGAVKFTKLRREIQMSNINRGILLPLLAAIALFVKQVWGYEISDEQINMYADLILYVIMFIGLFIKPRKEKPKNEQLDFTDGPAA